MAAGSDKVNLSRHGHHAEVQTLEGSRRGKAKRLVRVGKVLEMQYQGSSKDLNDTRLKGPQWSSKLLPSTDFKVN
jgi:hypothetical protein